LPIAIAKTLQMIITIATEGLHSWVVATASKEGMSTIQSPTSLEFYQISCEDVPKN
jgi:hypothetical protein